MKTKPTDDKSVGRRDFLKRVGAGAVGGTAALASAPFAGEAAAAESADEAKKARYDANSQDVKNYYRVNHYPAR
jgi:anaerobic selenocysteine-containing dehydrogenase